MKKLILGSSMLIGAGALVGSAEASDGIKLEVGGFFNTVYMGVFDDKKSEHFGDHRNIDAFQHNAEVYFKGETKLDNGLTIGARIELEGEDAADQIDKSFVYWSGGFGKVQIGSQNDALENYCVGAPGGTANFSAFSPTLGWGSNDPLKSNVYCKSADNDSQKVVYTTPAFAGFQLAVSYTPSANAETYGQAGVNGSGTPSNPDGTAHHTVTTYATYNYKGDGWGVQAGAGGSWQLKRNNAAGVNNGKGSAYQTGVNFNVDGFSAGGIFEYRGTGGNDNDAWIAGGGVAYAFDAWKIGAQYSHGWYDALFSSAAFGTDGHQKLDHVVATASYVMAPGIILDAEIGYTWYKDTHDAKPDATDAYQAFSVGIGSALTF
jgi:outer membrane protein OmpU